MKTMEIQIDVFGEKKSDLESDEKLVTLISFSFMKKDLLEIEYGILSNEMYSVGAYH